MTDPQLLREFIADEDEAFAASRQGKFWPSNHHRIGPLVPQAPKMLEAVERERLYFHLMRISYGIPAADDKELPLVLAAYRRLLQRLDQDGLPRHRYLFVFGFDENGELPSGETTSARALKARLKLIGQVSAYTNMPAQRDKKAKFLAFADQAVRILETFQHLGYRHDRTGAEEFYSYTDLAFWGMMFIGLLNKATRSELLADMLEGDFALMRRGEQLAILHRYVETVLPDVEPDETQFRALAEKLKDRERARREKTEGAALARALKLPFGDEDWEIYLAIPLRGETRPASISGNAAMLQIRPNPDRQWELRVRLSARGEFSESDAKVFRNELDLPQLGRGNLHAFPQWLRNVREKKGFDFDLEAADIRVGRKRAAAKLIAQWLRGEASS
ncbi:hypothetical protein [Oryzifoliimicrobium ureilyticus]|uniref:hypothetical protein n=1 Tax=Oryzifoliimicrobium ureilyticus TaxID=3113724 RepID=UPI0030767EDE